MPVQPKPTEPKTEKDALTVAIEMLENIAQGKNYDASDYHETLAAMRAIKPEPVKERNPIDADYVARAQEQYGREGEIEIDEGAIVSHGNDPGAYVAAWVWVDAVPEDDEDEEEGECVSDEELAEERANLSPEERAQLAQLEGDERTRIGNTPDDADESGMITKTNDGDLVCTCGNTTHLDGFVCCDDNGLECEPVKGIWSGCYLCQNCGATWQEEDAEAIARKQVPPDPEQMNDERSRGARLTLEYFTKHHGEEGEGLDAQNLANLMCNLAHYCDRNGLKFITCLETASLHYLAETDNEGAQFNS